MLKIKVIFAMLLLFFALHPKDTWGQTPAEWPMAAGNPQRTSWSPEEVRGNLTVEWYITMNAKMPREGEPIAANDKIFVSTAKGLFAFNASNGSLVWSYGTAMPLGNSPTYANGIVYVGSFDHRIHAVNASDGKLKQGWTFFEAEAGYETNPLVINNRIYIGNRDGYFYCFDANNGSLIWKWRDDSDEYPNAPIRFSAAYKDNVIYFGADNGHAYALRDNGTAASVVWKSAQLPGVGFNTYWPVVYHDKSSNKDYVLFSGSKKDTSFRWFSPPTAQADYYYYQENYEIFSGTSYGGLVGASGTTPGDWTPGTVTIDASKIVNYFNNKPHKRHLFVLEAPTGREFTPYAPVNWVSTTHGGNKRPPIIGGDGVIYTHIGYKNGDPGISPNMGASGGIAGWKFGTPYISRLYDFVRGYADETVKFTAGGNLIYWVEGFNMPYGAFEINRPYGSNASWTYAPCGGDCIGVPDHGFDSSFTPYKGKLYMLDGNTLIAFSNCTSNCLRGLNSVNPPPPTASTTTTVSTQALKQKLESEIQKILNAGPLRPGFHDSGIWGSYANGFYHPCIGTGCPADSPYITGNHIAEYFHNPSDTISTLYAAFPYISLSLQNQIKTYVHSNYGLGKQYDITSIAHVGWKNGAPREIFLDTPELLELMQRPTDDSRSSIASLPRNYAQYTQYQTKISTFPPESFYGAWKYAQMCPNQAVSVFNAVKTKLETPAISDANLLKYPYILNQFIAGYVGYVELGEIVGANVNTQQSTLNRLIDLRVNNFSKDSPFGGTGFTYENTLDYARNFMYLTPELASQFKSRALSKVQTALTEYNNGSPYWFVSKYDETYGEGVFQPLYDYNALFQARAYILNQPYDELTKYLDAPAFWRGDLYYIQNLVAALDVATLQGTQNNQGIQSSTVVWLPSLMSPGSGCE